MSNEMFASWVGTYYLGEDHIAIPSENITRWAEWMEKHERHVAEEHVCGARVSTVFLGVDHAFVSGPPVLFESLVFGGPCDGEQRRCSTWAEAVTMHQEMVALVKSMKEDDK